MTLFHDPSALEASPLSGVTPLSRTIYHYSLGETVIP